MFALKEYVAGLIFGWTWLEITESGVPMVSGRRFFTEKGASADWASWRERRGQARMNWRLVCLRRPYVDAWLDGWRVGDMEHSGKAREVLIIRTKDDYVVEALG